ncbi:hypothetical protein KEM52_006459 [Ascosphaera acerosa]|nr:hypothetical protein KEM52_006459 [Ascosphaera acerosa]
MAPQPPALAPSAAQQEAAAAHQRFLETLDLTRQPRPFRNPHWKPNPRRNKNLRQILSEGNRKDAAAAAARAQRALERQQQQQQQQSTSSEGAGTTTTTATTSTSAATQQQHVTYTSIASAPSLRVMGHKSYCDITGLAAKYTDPKSRLRYHDKEIFAVIRSLPQASVDAYLEARGANIILK